MDQVWANSFLRVEDAERRLRTLARSRVDTTREVVFEPIGVRFAEVRQDTARAAALLREDARLAEKGRSSGFFSGLLFRVDASTARRLAALDPWAVEERVRDAARAVLARELPRAQGVILARFEHGANGAPEPVAHVTLSCRQSDGGPTPRLDREWSDRLQQRWTRELEKAFAPARGPVRTSDREQPDRSVLGPDAERLRQDHARASTRLVAVYADRLGGRATRADLLDALDHVRQARNAWGREVGMPINLRDVDRRPVFDLIRVRIEGGSRYLSGPLEAHRRAALEIAASRAAGLPDGAQRHVAVVPWPAGKDMHAVVVFNQRGVADRPSQAIDPDRLRAALEARLADELHRYASSLDPTAEARRGELGRIEARLPSKAPEPERVPARVEPAESRPPGGAIVVAFRREERRDAAVPLSDREIADLQPGAARAAQQRDWMNERVFTVRLSIPTGAERLQRAQLSEQDAARIVQRAVDRAYPFLEQLGVRGNFKASTRDKALDVRIMIPVSAAWTRAQLQSEAFEKRFHIGFHTALSQATRAPSAIEKVPAASGIVRGLSAVRAVPTVMRQAEQDPERAARDLVRAAFSKLSEALPKPFRAMRDAARGIGRLMSRSPE